MKKSTTETIGDRLRVFRESTNLTQAQFALLMNMSTTGLQSNESNRSLPNSKLLLALYAKGLNVNWLLSGEGEMLLRASKESIPPQLGGNINVYAEAMEVIDLFLQKNQRTLTPEKKRQAVDALYHLSMDKGGKIDTQVAEMIMQLAA